jgi:hypothetical protein
MRDVIGFCYEAFAPHLFTYDIRYPYGSFALFAFCVSSLTYL